MRVLLLLILAMSVSCSTSRSLSRWWAMDDYGILYSLPPDWSADPFSSSSVCDCPGIICNNDGWKSGYVRMVVYMTQFEADLTLNRGRVWGHDFEQTGESDKVTFAGIPYRRDYGTFVDSDFGQRAIRLVSSDTPRKDEMHFTIYFFGSEMLMEKNDDLFWKIMGTIKRKKVDEFYD